MKSLTTQEQYEYFVDTLKNCGMFLLDCNDDDIGYYIFEEFVSNCVSFLSEQNLGGLLQNGFINSQIYSKSLTLREKFLKIYDSTLFKVALVKTNEQWREVLRLSDKIKALVAQFEDKRKAKVN